MSKKRGRIPKWVKKRWDTRLFEEACRIEKERETPSAEKEPPRKEGSFSAERVSRLVFS